MVSYLRMIFDGLGSLAYSNFPASEEGNREKIPPNPDEVLMWSQISENKGSQEPNRSSWNFQLHGIVDGERRNEPTAEFYENEVPQRPNRRSREKELAPQCGVLSPNQLVDDQRNLPDSNDVRTINRYPCTSQQLSQETIESEFQQDYFSNQIGNDQKTVAIDVQDITGLGVKVAEVAAISEIQEIADADFQSFQQAYVPSQITDSEHGHGPVGLVMKTESSKKFGDGVANLTAVANDQKNNAATNAAQHQPTTQTNKILQIQTKASEEPVSAILDKLKLTSKQKENPHNVCALPISTNQKNIKSATVALNSETFTNSQFTKIDKKNVELIRVGIGGKTATISENERLRDYIRDLWKFSNDKEDCSFVSEKRSIALNGHGPVVIVMKRGSSKKFGDGVANLPAVANDQKNNAATDAAQHQPTTHANKILQIQTKASEEPVSAISDKLKLTSKQKENPRNVCALPISTNQKNIKSATVALNSQTFTNSRFTKMQDNAKHSPRTQSKLSEIITVPVNEVSSKSNSGNKRSKERKQHSQEKTQRNEQSQSQETTMGQQGNKDEFTSRVIGLVVGVTDQRFRVKIEEEPYLNQYINCFSSHLADSSVPVIAYKTRLLLGIKVKDQAMGPIVLWGRPHEYIKISEEDVWDWFDNDFTHEDIVYKLYFAWRTFFTSILSQAYNIERLPTYLMLEKILPPEHSSSKGDRNHQLRFQEILELMISKESTFLRILGYDPEYDGRPTIKRLIKILVSVTKRLDPVQHLLRLCYFDDVQGLLELLDSCATGSVLQIESLADHYFREVPLIPVMDELAGVISKVGHPELQNLLQLESHLIPNRIDGPWDSTEEFLNVHFRLLREECFASIRDRIANIRMKSSRPQYVHSKVKVIGYAISDGTIVVKIHYKPHKARTNMMFGNLLCIDSDTRFSHPIWATVQSSGKNSTEISIMLVGVGSKYADTSGKNSDGLPTADLLVSGLQQLISCPSSIMVESPTYYHAFRPILARLQGLSDNEFPFASEILLKSVKPEKSTMRFCKLYQSRNIDESQSAAIEMSLRSRFSLIQGPPGCGKTFVGKEIVKNMLTNKSFEGPILVMTYKNRALDGILEGCLEFTKSVVRVGGNSTSEVLAEYNLHNLHDEAKKFFPREKFKQLKDAQTQVQNVKSAAENAAKELLNDFTVNALLRFLTNRGSIEQQQIHSLLSMNFVANYSTIINAPVNYSSLGEINEALADILEIPTTAEKLLHMSLGQWLSDSDSIRFLPKPRSLFIDNISTHNHSYSNYEEYNELEEEEYEHVFAERCVGAESKLDFIRVTHKSNTLYPRLQESMAYLKPDAQEWQVRTIENVWSLSPEGRYILLSYWLRELRKGNTENLSEALDRYKGFYQQVKELEDGRNVAFLRSRDLVACTITGCCLRMGVISRMAPAVAIVEEAAEILESQLIAAIPSSVKHVVLIGDHRQLPPQVHHFRLATKFNLGVSIFERLASNGYPISQLRFHRRGPQSLCPLFSRFYDQKIVALNQDPQLPKIFGKLGVMYWWSHSSPACNPANSTSFENKYEAIMVAGTVRLMIELGKVEASKISIICGYLAQATLIKKLLANDQIEDVTVCTVDQFQGDENDYILLSLTRSASEDSRNPSLGFLASPNRACVALSRARLGLLIFGCSSLFGSHKTWRPTVDYFRQRGSLGRDLQFVVSPKSQLTFNHPADFTMFFKKLDFERKEIRVNLQNLFAKELSFKMREGIHDVTNQYGKKIQELMNLSVLDKNDLGIGRDADGIRFDHFKVNNVRQVFNKDLYSFYLLQMTTVEKAKPPQLKFKVDSWANWMKDMKLNKKVNEVLLFHGTPNAEVAKIIAQNGFDERIANLKGMYGAGTYFAENADKSDQYTSGPTHIMFLARVILGNPFESPEPTRFRRPPPINPKKPDKLYDSVIALSRRKSYTEMAAQAANYRHQEFILYDGYQCYPEFIIDYEHV